MHAPHGFTIKLDKERRLCLCRKRSSHDKSHTAARISTRHTIGWFCAVRRSERGSCGEVGNRVSGGRAIMIKRRTKGKQSIMHARVSSQFGQFSVSSILLSCKQRARVSHNLPFSLEYSTLARRADTQNPFPLSADVLPVDDQIRLPLFLSFGTLARQAADQNRGAV